MSKQSVSDPSTGSPEDLKAFVRLANSPIRSEERNDALREWEAYKQRRIRQRWIDQQSEPPRPDSKSTVRAVLAPGPGDGPSVKIVRPPRRQQPVMTKGWYVQALTKRLIDLRGANLNGICLGYSDMRGLQLDGADLRGAWLKGAELEHASLKEADLSPRPDQPQPYEHRVGNGASRLLRANLAQADLSGADLQGADISIANLYKADLRKANLSGANLSGSILVDADLRDADLSNTDLSNASLVGAKLQGTELTGSRIHGISVWDVMLCDDASKRQNLIVTKPEEPEVRVDDLEVAQFIYLLLNRKKLRNVIEAVTQKGVLVLGRFNEGGLDDLQKIAAALRNEGYLPMLFDFDKPRSKSLTGTVRAVANLARFVIVDPSGASVPHELATVVPATRIPFIPILQKNREPYAMFESLVEDYDWVSHEIIDYDDIESISENLKSKVINPAEAILKRLDEGKRAVVRR